MPNDINGSKRVLFFKDRCFIVEQQKKNRKVCSGIYCICYKGISKQFMEEE